MCEIAPLKHIESHLGAVQFRRGAVKSNLTDRAGSPYAIDTNYHYDGISTCFINKIEKWNVVVNLLTDMCSACRCIPYRWATS